MAPSIVITAPLPGFRTVGSFTRQGLSDKLAGDDWVAWSTHERELPMRIGPLTYRQVQYYAYVVPRAMIADHEYH